MDLIIGGRQMGKTSKLIEIARENNYTIVEPSKLFVDALKAKLGENDIQVISVRDLPIMGGRCKIKGKGLLFDDATRCMKILFDHLMDASIEGMSINVNVPGFHMDTDDSDDYTAIELYRENIKEDKRDAK